MISDQQNNGNSARKTRQQKVVPLEQW